MSEKSWEEKLSFIKNKGIFHYKGSGDLSIHDDNMNNNIYVHKKTIFLIKVKKIL